MPHAETVNELVVIGVELEPRQADGGRQIQVPVLSASKEFRRLLFKLEVGKRHPLTLSSGCVARKCPTKTKLIDLEWKRLTAAVDM